ncbi:hypothetical protein S245_006623, partial [Arachis hypogaea]
SPSLVARRPTSNSSPGRPSSVVRRVPVAGVLAASPSYSASCSDHRFAPRCRLCLLLSPLAFFLPLHMATMDLPSHSIWNYVVTAQKPSCVTHASVGKFTDPQACNLILGKGTHIEIYSFTSERLQLIVDVPVHGRISALQLFQPSDGKGDSLFVLISRCQAYVFQWNPKISWPTIRWVEDCLRVWSPPARARNNGQIGIIDPACRLVALSLYENVLQVIPLTKGRKRKSHFIRLDEDILDMKFLYNSKTTLVLLQVSNSIFS